jgi:DNA-binding NarL/FixJ family response regulator
MAKTIKTHLLCYDDRRSFTEDIRKRFDDTSRYQVTSFLTHQDFIAHCEKEKESNACKVAIIGIPDAPDQYKTIETLTADIKKIDIRTGLILLGPPDKMEELKKVVRFNIDAYVPKNSNSVLRVHNTVKKLISEHNIGIFRKRRNISLYFLLAFLVLAAIFIVIARFRFPGYF